MCPESKTQNAHKDNPTTTCPNNTDKYIGGKNPVCVFIFGDPYVFEQNV